MLRLLKKSIALLRVEGLNSLSVAARRKLRNVKRNVEYRKWVAAYDQLTDEDRREIKRQIEAFDRRPLISVLMPVYNVEERFLREAIESVRSQLYEDWELCIADDRSPSSHVRRVLEEYIAADQRIKVVFRDENGHISAASNSALEIVTGEFTALMDHDDLLAEDALFQVAKVLNASPQTNLVYSDEDKIDESGKRFQPMFKPDWSPELFTSLNLVTHLCAFRTTILRDIGGFSVGLEGSQDYDLSLRFIEQITPETIRHVPLVLYHWRAIRGSVALDPGEKSYAHERARTAIREHYERTGIKATVIKGVGELHRTRYEITGNEPKVTLILADMQFEKQLLETSDWAKVETIIAGKGPRFTSLSRAVEDASGELIVIVSDTARKASQGWMRELVSRALVPGVGAVGGKVADTKGRVVHGGYLIGVAGGIGRAHFGYRASDRGEFERAAVDQNFSAISSECMAFRKDAFEAAGGFNENAFAANFGDIDLCLKLIKQGKRIVWTPWAQLTAAQPHRSEDTEALEELKRRWPRVFERDPFYNPNLSADAEDLAFAFPPRIRHSDQDKL